MTYTDILNSHKADIDVFYKKYQTPFARKLYWALHQEVEEKLKVKNG